MTLRALRVLVGAVLWASLASGCRSGPGGYQRQDGAAIAPTKGSDRRATAGGVAADETSFAYSDGSGNTYRLAPLRVGTLDYAPVTPGRSSSGFYSGGRPFSRRLTAVERTTLVDLFRRAIEDDKSHIPQRIMMSGLIRINDGSTETVRVLAPASPRKKAIEEFLRGLARAE